MRPLDYHLALAKLKAVADIRDELIVLRPKNHLADLLKERLSFILGADNEQSLLRAENPVQRDMEQRPTA